MHGLQPILMTQPNLKLIGHLTRPAAKVVNLEVAAGRTLPYNMIKEALETHKPAVLFLCQVPP